MNCNERYDDILRYADGEMDCAAASEMELHLAGCELCRNRLEALESAHSCLRDSMSQLEESPGMAGQVLAALPHRRRFTALKWISASGFAAAACLIVWLNSPTQHKPVKRVNLPEKVLAKVHTPSPLPVPEPETRIPGIPRVGPNPEAKRTTWEPRQHRPITEEHRQVPAQPAHKPAKIEPDTSPATSIACVQGPSGISLSIEQQPAGSDEYSTRSRMIIRTKICGVEFARTREIVTLPPPPDTDSESIERPPLRTVVTPVVPGTQLDS